MKHLLSIFFVLIGSFVGEVFATTVDGVRLWRSPDSTRLVFDLDSATKYSVFPLSAPRRLVIDIDNARSAADLSKLKLDNTPIARIRPAAKKNGSFRFVLDLKEEVKLNDFTLSAIADKPHRLVLDLYDLDRKPVKTAESVLADNNLVSKRDIVIAIDAGHGGEDPGAVGPGRLYEKHIVLKVAKNLANTINKVPGYKAVLVRTGDYFISLKRRPEKARDIHADLFLSIHADGFDRPSARGASVFTLSNEASSRTARILARKENESDLIGGAERIQLKGKEDDVRKTLLDLSFTNSLLTSSAIGRRILKELGRVTALHSSRVESAGFAVLKAADVPSLLIETGFITNPGEAKKLNTLHHRTKLARAIFKGIDAYFNEYPPEGSYLAWKKSGGGALTHVIKRGDTLSGISKRYQVSVAQIKKENKLTSSKIRVGQTLVIPAG